MNRPAAATRSHVVEREMPTRDRGAGLTIPGTRLETSK